MNARDKLVTIDFEASALRGYPIEVGVARWDRDAGRITTWSSLIRPIPYWRDRPPRWWDPRAQEIHGIAPSDLDAGMTSKRTMLELNAMIGDLAAHCDGGTIEDMFLHRLRDAAGVAPTFGLANLRALCVAAGRSKLGTLCCEEA